MLFSDDYRIPEARERMSELLNPKLLEIAKKGTTFLPVETDTGNRASRSFVRDDGDIFYLALFNYTHEDATYAVDCATLGDLPAEPVFESLDGKHSFYGKNFTVQLLPAQSVILCCKKV